MATTWMQIPEIAGEVLEEAGRTGGWAAILLGVMIIAAVYFTYLLARYALEHQRADAEEMRKSFQAQLERERLVTDRYDSTLHVVNTTFGEVGEVMRQTNDLLSGTRHALERNTELLERISSRRYWGEGEGR